MTVDLGLIVTIGAALLGTGGIGALVKIWVDRRDGTEERRVAEVERMKQLLDQARRRADVAEAGKRIYAEQLSLARRIMFAADCIDPATVPPWPETPKE